MKIFLNSAFFIFLINGYLNPIFSFQDINHRIFINKKNLNIYLHKDLLIVNKDNSKKETFTLKEIPDYSVEKLKNSVKQNKDPFTETLSGESSSFEDLYLILLGLFKINDEKTAMFFTKEGIKNYIIGDKIQGYYEIKDIDLLSNEVLITDGKEQKFYSFPEK
tara:strand:- start:389 stop:877 length:489 start_codon:yes stop_codon:yes gene_type:complete